MTYPNIALTGAMRSGKDSVGSYLCQRYRYVRFAFGDELKNDFHHRYPEIPREPKPRKGYQTHGQLMREYVDEDVWLSLCLANIRDWADEADLSDTFMGAEEPSFRAVITDLRQPNEYARCRAEGYAIIRVKATSALRIQRAVESADTFDLRDLTHETEQHTDSFTVDYEITNDGTLAELHAQIDAVMTKINGMEANV